MSASTSSFRFLIRAALGIVAATFAQVVAAATPGALDNNHASVRAVIALQSEVTPGLMSSEAVLGTAVGADENALPVLVVFVDHNHGGMADVVRSLPSQIRGIGVKIEKTEKFRALKGPPNSGDAGNGTVSHKTKQALPIQLGTSGGWSKDLANGYCCAGTLGALVQVNGVKFILSNYHVFEADIVPGGNGFAAQSGDPVIQPGLIDVNCNVANATVVGALRKLSSLPNSNVDCSVAEVVGGAVSPSILEIGNISSQTAAAAINQAVKKSGRTTGLTRSKISGLNATIRVTYENECAGGTAFTKTFTGQIVVTNRGSGFLNGGDSGSLMVEDINSNPRAVGLLYAGSSTSAIANPISDVLTFIGGKLDGTATMVSQ